MSLCNISTMWMGGLLHLIYSSVVYLFILQICVVVKAVAIILKKI
jgi:hypothetical protein